MINLRTKEIELVHDKDFLPLLKWHTQRVRFGIFNLLFFVIYDYSKDWVGEFDKTSNSFKLIRFKKFIPGSVGLSSVLVVGNISEKNDKKSLQVKFYYRSSILLLLITLSFLTFLGVNFIGMDFIIEYWWVVLIFILIMIINTLILLIDLNNTENALLDLISKSDIE